MPKKIIRTDIHEATDKLLKQHGDQTRLIVDGLKKQFPNEPTIKVNAYYYIKQARNRAAGIEKVHQKPGPKNMGLTNVTVGLTKEQLAHLEELAGGNISAAVRFLVDEDMREN